MRPLTPKGLVRAAALIALGAAVLAGVAAVQTRPRGPIPIEVSPASGALARCRALGEAAEQDADCQATWRALREHFFDQTEARRP